MCFTQRIAPATFGVAAALFTSSLVSAQDRPTIKEVPMPRTSVTSGVEMFEAYCSACHGLDGKGRGPAAAALKTRPTNLTQLADKNDGEFPARYVIQVLELGPAMSKVHGTEEMPIWGSLFRRSGEDSSFARMRLYNLTRYVESIQDPPAHPKHKESKPVIKRITDIEVNSGSAMYHAYCASCHGTDGRGGGPSAHTLKASAPDLSLLATNNGGKFPATKVQHTLGWLAGTEAHGSKEMPIWGNLFRQSQEDNARVALRIRNITEYVESLQR